MHRTSMPVAVVAGARAEIKTLSFEECPDVACGLVVGAQLAVDRNYSSQVAVVNAHLERFRDTLSRTAAPLLCANRQWRVALGDVRAVEGESHGLALLLAGLGLQLGVAPLQDRVFSAAVGDPKGRDVQLRGTGELVAKARAAGLAGIPVLYHCADEETPSTLAAIRQYEAEHFGGGARAECRLVGLRQELLWANLMNIGLDLRSLWERLGTEPSHVGTLLGLAHSLLHAAFRSPSTIDEYPCGVGAAVAAVRGAGACPGNFADSIAFADCARTCPDDFLPDFVKLAVSTDPMRTIEEDMRAWGEAPNDSRAPSPHRTPIGQALVIYELAERYEWLDNAALTRIRATLIRRVDELCAEAMAGRAPVAELTHLSACVQKMSTRVAELLRCILVRTEPYRRTNDQARRLHAIASMKLMSPDAVVDGGIALRLTFRSHAQTQDAPRLNALALEYHGAGLNARVDGPVVLVDDAVQHGPYVRRNNMCRADALLSRIRAADADYIEAAFGPIPSRIEFSTDGTIGNAAKYIGVIWNESQVPFPPAIDSQFLAHAMLRHAGFSPDSSMRTLADVGCGTGYLAAIALHAWPTIEHVELIDIDRLTVVAAAENLQHACRRESAGHDLYGPAASNVTVGCWAGDFCRHQLARRFDMIVSNPPYLPEQQVVGEGINRATKGTVLLEHLVARGPEIARILWITFSSLAWREFERSLSGVARKYRRITLVDRNFVPLRLTNIEPVPAGGRRDGEEYERRRRYYDMILRPRGLLDLDAPTWDSEKNAIVGNAPRLHGLAPECTFEDLSGIDSDTCRDRLESIHADSHGFRFWHETRVLMLESALGPH